MDNSKIDLNLLVALEALLAERNVTHAARRLNISQPALSAQLSRLRALFGDQLMIPTSRGVVPTALAIEMQASIREVLDKARGIVSGAQTFEPGTAEVVFRVSASDYMQIAVLLPFLTRMNATAPGIRIIVRLLDPLSVASQLERGDIDVAFVQSGNADGAGVHGVDVLSETYVGIARTGTVNGAAMTMEEFLSRRHIIVSPTAKGFAGPTDDALAGLGLKRDVAFSVASFVFLAEAVAQSDLIAMAPKRLAERYDRTLDTFTPPVDIPGFDISMTWHDRTQTHPARQWFRSELLKFCQSQ